MKYKDLFEFMPNLTREADFDEFWKESINHINNVPLNLRVKQIDYPTDYVDVYEIIFNGFDDTDLYGYVLRPKFVNKKMPVVINYHGYGWNGGIPAHFMHFVTQGLAVITFDIRGQLGKSGNNLKSSNGSNSVMTQGILNEYEYYYRAVYGDCIKILDVVNHFDFMDKEKIILHGGSQGGGLVMAVASLDDRAKLVLADVPSYSYFEGRYNTSSGSMGSVVSYVKVFPHLYERVMKTLSYFDTMNMAHLIKANVLASVGMKDNVCPARCFFPTYNRITAPKEIKIYDLGGHEGGDFIHLEEKMRFIKENI